MDGDPKGPSSNCEEGHGSGQGKVGVGVGENLAWATADGGLVADGDPHGTPFIYSSKGKEKEIEMEAGAEAEEKGEEADDEDENVQGKEE